MTTMTMTTATATMTEGPASIRPGTRLSGRYRLDEELGRGGAGRVFRAHDERLDRAVAVKVLTDLGDSATTRFRREAATAARIRHANVVTLHDAGVDGVPYLVMTLVDGPSLDERVRADGPLEPAAVERLAEDLFAALAATHAAGVLHRDLTPRNVLLDPDGDALVADFGIARGVDDPTVTAEHTVMGTRPYVAPERLRGEEATPASDVYAVGVTLRFAATGRADTAMPATHPLAELVERCTSPEPSHRPGVDPTPVAPATEPLVTTTATTPADDVAATAAMPTTESVPATTVIPSQVPVPTRTGLRAGRPTLLTAGALFAAAIVLALGAMGSDDLPDDPGTGTAPVEAEPAADTGETADPAAPTGPAFDPAAPGTSARDLAEWLRAQDD